MKNHIFMFKKLYRSSKRGTISIFIGIIVSTAVVVMALLLSQSIVVFVVDKATLDELLRVLVPKVLVLTLLMIIETIIKYEVLKLVSFNRMNSLTDNIEKSLRTDFQNLLKPDYQRLMNHALVAGSNENELYGVYVHQITSLLHQVLQIGILGSMLFVLDQTFLILIMMMLIFTILYRIYQMKIVDEMRGKRTEYIKKMDYLISESGDFKVAKDMRVFGVKGWFNDIFNHLVMQANGLLKRTGFVVLGGQIISGILVSALSGFGYFVFVKNYLNFEMTLAELTFFIGALSTISIGLFTLVNACFDIFQSSKDLVILRSFYDFPDSLNHEGIPFDFAEITSIVFENVSFTYPDTQEAIFNNFNVTILKDEKIAVVGLNGAGKSTLVKLICNLVKPDSGRILINGVNNQDFNLTSYYDQLSVVFQEQYSLPITIKETILQGSNYDEERYRSVLEQSGVVNFLDKFPQRDDTSLVQAFDAESVNLSGGQHQRLKLAQALYKEGKIIILDEPTAALDPIAESEIYQKYFDLSENRISLFITHRLASTRFCDRIIYIEQGDIVEDGSHDVLMNLNGKYRELFDKQAYYYQEEIVYE